MITMTLEELKQFELLLAKFKEDFRPTFEERYAFLVIEEGINSKLATLAVDKRREENKRFNYVVEKGYTKAAALSINNSEGRNPDYNSNLEISNKEECSLEQFSQGNTRIIFKGNRLECQKFLELNDMPYKIFAHTTNAIPHKKGSWMYEYHTKKEAELK